MRHGQVCQRERDRDHMLEKPSDEVTAETSTKDGYSSCKHHGAYAASCVWYGPLPSPPRPYAVIRASTRLCKLSRAPISTLLPMTKPLRRAVTTVVITADGGVTGGRA